MGLNCVGPLTPRFLSSSICYSDKRSSDAEPGLQRADSKVVCEFSTEGRVGAPAPTFFKGHCIPKMSRSYHLARYLDTLMTPGGAAPLCMVAGLVSKTQA